MDQQQEYNISIMDNQDHQPVVAQKSPNKDDYSMQVDDANAAKLNELSQPQSSPNNSTNSKLIELSTSNQDVPYTGQENPIFQADDPIIMQDSNDDTHHDHPITGDPQDQIDDDNTPIPYQQQ